MHKRARQAMVTVLTGVTLVTGASTAAEATPLQAPQSPVAPGRPIDVPTIAPPVETPLTPAATPTPTPTPSGAPAPAPAATPTATDPAASMASALPSGKCTATSFWDAQTASGSPMRYQTIASPYWPLGTTVKITYQGRSAIGVVEDFGPAEWAVAQHDIPAITDLSEEMMADLSGVRSNTVHVTFQVLKWGTGGVYRHSGTGYDLAMGRG
ncbi:septal ring lytic transglycosylase RlpA family protein [Planotetraspora sp. A-T 1434]|uniref:septal ring lytic transglycosylase RlpA family protein n=1 Tax=Planotetraspora sp. A-T 1434 TaxID=2979219 RepID=UPI0021C03CE0|nr:septal ring lytic transglycosylase RlpA family protein [Planotetraspora sp. A-T 1434]MCT9929977.1 septal ring lytic transglycosylase RlpA family protein [Planotetraspora sp. A-T 1434]